MVTDARPTAEDLSRRLADDLEVLLDGACDARQWKRWVTENAEAGWGAACRRALAAEAEVARLRTIVESLAARCHAQSELLTRRAENG